MVVWHMRGGMGPQPGCFYLYELQSVSWILGPYFRVDMEFYKGAVLWA